MALKDWQFSKKGPKWPKDDAGEPVSPTYLTHLRATDMEGTIAVSLLESNGIPVVTQYPNDGSFGKVILGFSGTGIDLYVPETLLEEAQDLMAGITDSDADGLEIEEEHTDNVQN